MPFRFAVFLLLLTFSTPVLLLAQAGGAGVEDFESGAFDLFPWEHGGNKSWLINTPLAFNGKFSARSGAIGHGEHSELRIDLVISEPGEISFARRVSTEANWDVFSFFVDGVAMASWSGELPWDVVAFPVTQGMHTFTWKYSKDPFTSSGNDRVWIDAVRFPPFTIVVHTVTPPQETPQLQMNIFPNPAQDRYRLIFELPEASPVLIELLDSDGKRLDFWEKDLPAGVQAQDFLRQGNAPALRCIRVTTNRGSATSFVVFQ